MNKPHKRVFEQVSLDPKETLPSNKNSSNESRFKLTYLEYLKEKYTRENEEIKYRRKNFHELKVERNCMHNHVIIEVSNEHEEQRRKKINIFKKVFKFQEQKPKNEDVDGFVWIELEEDPETKKRKTLRWKLRKYFLQNPKLENETRKEGDDFMYEDFVLVDPEESRDLPPQNKFLGSLIDFTAGSLAGIIQVYVSQPLDTVKVKQQTFPKLYGSMLKCFLRTYHQDGIVRGLYAGTFPAIVASVAENSVLFLSYGLCQHMVAYVMSIDKVSDLSAFGNACAGFWAAFITSFSLCPTELVKCKLQAVNGMKHYVSEKSTAPTISTSQLTRDIFLNEGIGGFYRGLSSTLVREMPGVFFFFGSYEATRQFLAEPNQSKEDIGSLKTMCAGAVGGIMLWTSTFPADVIKSRIQINNLNGGMLSIGIKILRDEGLMALYKGLLPSIIRTIPATATLFLVYENTRKILEGVLLNS